MENGRKILSYNDRNIEILKEKIHKCIRNNENFRILCFDIDDTLNRSKQATEEQIEQINFKASEKYRRMYYKSHPFCVDQDSSDFRNKFADLRNQILEDYGEYNGSINYDLIHNLDRLYPTAYEGFREIGSNIEGEKNTFIILFTMRCMESSRQFCP